MEEIEEIEGHGHEAVFNPQGTERAENNIYQNSATEEHTVIPTAAPTDLSNQVPLFF